MTTETTEPRTRRALLTTGLGAAAAAGMAVLGGQASSRAANGDALKLGEENSATAATKITVSGDVDGLEVVTSSNRAVVGESASGLGVVGLSQAGIGFGVAGLGTTAGVMGIGVASGAAGAMGLAGDATGVYGVSGDTATSAKALARRLRRGVAPAGGVSFSFPPKTGVYGEANQDTTAKGVSGRSTVGTAIHGASASGYALRTEGRLSFSTSGVAVIGKGSTSAIITPGVDVTSSSFVLLTPKGNIGPRGLWYTTNAGLDRITIRISSALPSNLQVAWLLVG